LEAIKPEMFAKHIYVVIHIANFLTANLFLESALQVLLIRLSIITSNSYECKTSYLQL